MRLAGKVEVMTTLIAIDGMRAAETRAQAQEALGHASVATTQRYTAVTRSEVRAVSEAAA